MSNSKSPPPAPHPWIQWTTTFVIRFAPLGGSLGILGSFLLDQAWLKAVVMFFPTVATTIWAGYSKSFLENIGKRSETWGEHNSNVFADWVERSARTLTQIVTKPEARYLECQRRDCVYNDIDGYEQRNVLLLQDIFVPLRLTHTNYACGPMGSGNLRQDQVLLSREDLSIWELLRQVPRRPEYSRMVILAKGGYGKTTLLRHIAYTYCEPTYRKFKVQSKVPVLIYLRRWWTVLAQADAPDLPTLMMDHHIPVLPGGKDMMLPADWAKTLLGQGGALVMVDGFDEVAEDQRAAVSGWLNQQMQWYPQNWFILTSRHDGYYQGYEGKHHFKSTVSVPEFKPEPWQRFIHQWFLCTERGRRADSDRNITTVKSAAEDRANALIAQIKAPERLDLAEMATNPLMLNMLTLWYQFYHTKTLPRYRAELYGSIIKMQLKDRPEAKGVELPLPLKDSRRVLQWLAMAMQANKTLQISNQRILAFLAETLKALDETMPAATLLAWLRDRSELLVERNANQYEFSHRSFQSYLAAAEMGQRGKEEWLLDQWEQGQSADQDDEKQKDWWHETIILYVAQQDNPNRAIQGLMQRGAAMLAYKCWQETSKQIKPVLRAELEPLANQVQNFLYGDLERYLQQQKWREADKETYQVMIAVLGKEKGDWFTMEELRTFPCEDLLRIDRLWWEASNDHFGFSVQKAIWKECGSPMDYNDDWKRFGDRVGWRKDGSWFAYGEVTFDTSAPRAHLPCFYGVGGGLCVGVSSLSSRLAKCSR